MASTKPTFKKAVCSKGNQIEGDKNQREGKIHKNSQLIKTL